MSCSPSKGRDCVVLLLHRPDGELSFARVGDDRWTHIIRQTLRWVSGYRDAIYNEIDGLFYVLSFDGSMNTLDLGDPSSPVSKDIMPLAIPWDDPIKDLVLTPSGFPRLSPDSAYVTDGFDEEMCGNKHNLREIGIWDFKTETLRGLGGKNYAGEMSTVVVLLNNTFPSPIGSPSKITYVRMNYRRIKRAMFGGASSGF
ncbi:unnamed protein product [Miscanthus lutarioriparius]|uniref:KIB1-4 beta-propeller domain-containing protein n=1 Tax=Miscanthus lutarioriparius TaxID=422564 RepID=A0A811QB83_9POAL|nr:unnamed protein product [Miscanthus lutarioriparius]